MFPSCAEVIASELRTCGAGSGIAGQIQTYDTTLSVAKVFVLEKPMIYCSSNVTVALLYFMFISCFLARLLETIDSNLCTHRTWHLAVSFALVNQAHDLLLPE